MSEQAQETNGQTPALNKALAAVQGKLPKISKAEQGVVTGKTKDGRPYSYTYNYADLSGISPIVFPLLAEEGLSFMCRPTQVEGRFFLLYELRHASGEVVGGRYPLRADGGPQDIGKEITYARRYALCAVTGIAPGDDDDDGASAQQAHQQDRLVDRDGLDRVLAPANPPAQRAKRPAKPKAGDAESETAAAQRRKYHVLREQLGWDEQAGHDFISDLSDGRAERWTDLDTPAKRGAVLDRMQDEIDTLNQVGAALPTEEEPTDG